MEYDFYVDIKNEQYLCFYFAIHEDIYQEVFTESEKGEKGMVFTWIGDVGPLLEKSCYQRYWRQLPDFRKEKAERYGSMEGRALSAGAWVLWQQAREAYQLSEDTPFNLSHSGRYVLCAVQVRGKGTAQVGCDVQQMGKYRGNVAKRFFSPEEYDHIQSQENEESRKELFFRYWALKESFIKATRRGMAMALDSFCFCMEEGRNPALKRCPEPYKKGDYFFQEFGLQSYRAAVCSTDPEIAPDLQWIQF